MQRGRKRRRISTPLVVRAAFEPSRLAEGCLAEAYEHAVPVLRRATTGPAALFEGGSEAKRKPRRRDGPLNDVRAAVYARVSSKQQANARTIDGQMASLRERVVDDGLELNDTILTAGVVPSPLGTFDVKRRSAVLVCLYRFCPSGAG